MNRTGFGGKDVIDHAAPVLETGSGDGVIGESGYLRARMVGVVGDEEGEERATIAATR